MGELDEFLLFGSPETRRKFIKQIAGTSAAITIGPALVSASSLAADESAVASATKSSTDSVKVQDRHRYGGGFGARTTDAKDTMGFVGRPFWPPIFAAAKIAALQLRFYLPPKNFLNDWKSLFGKVTAFWPKFSNLFANIWSPPCTSQATVGILSTGKSIS